MTATLLAFSSYYALYFSDSVSGDMSPGLFGVMLVFHGMVLHVKQGRFGQLAVKSCIALLLDWHVYALLLPYVVLSFCDDAVRAWSASCVTGRVRLLAAVLALLRSRSLALGVVALLFGAAVLAFNFAQ